MEDEEKKTMKNATKVKIIKQEKTNEENWKKGKIKNGKPKWEKNIEEKIILQKEK